MTPLPNSCGAIGDRCFDWPCVEAIVAVVIGVPLAAGASAYGRRLALDR
jgi:hypothetical protein